jgi:hypothetical protein
MKVFRVVSVLVFGLSFVGCQFASAKGIDSKDSLYLRVIRCFEVSEVKVVCNGELPVRDAERIEELEISAKDWSGQMFFYGYGKMIQGPLCQEHIRKIRRLLKRANEVCISGDGESPLDAGGTFVRWKALETRRGHVTW